MSKNKELDQKNLSTEYRAFEQGREFGRIEGMITYQKHLIDNIQKENVKLTEKLKTLNKEPIETVVDFET
ncbi:hypothetical protein [uncultured Bacteroides sp.]|uniref:hypothetical protein n=1 Tax=uncultured Bacteroides sp. TaxID=162156 RepID=UPI002AAAA445|nr:hypothetical protein [uncultured Bacteroides sp.]